MRSDPWGGWAFGSRYLIPSFAVLSIFLGLALAHYRRHLLFLVAFLILGGYSVYVNTAGALGSIASPPQVEVLSLEALTHQPQKYSFDRNLALLHEGSSQSYIYQSYLKPYLSTWQFYQLLVGLLTGVITSLTLIHFFRRSA